MKEFFRKLFTELFKKDIEEEFEDEITKENVKLLKETIIDNERIIQELQKELLIEQEDNINLTSLIKELEPKGNIALDLYKDGLHELKWVNKDYKLSNNFKVSEFLQNDGMNYLKLDMKLVNILQKVRDKYGKAVKVTSGYRSPSYNKNVGGVTTSHHLNGQAADFKVSGVSKNTILAYVKTLPEVSYAYTNSTNMKYVVHVNI